MISTTTRYHLVYDAFGNTTKIGVSAPGSTSISHVLATYSYNGYNGKMTSMAYSNDTTVGYVYDTLDRLSSVKYNDVTRYTYSYNDDNQLAGIVDAQTGVNITYTYDRIGRLIKEETSYPAYGNIPASTVKVEYSYDDAGRMSNKIVTIGSISSSYIASYEENSSRLASLSLPSGANIQYSYDGLERTEVKQVVSGSTVLAKNTYTYETITGGKTSNRIVQEVLQGGTTYVYTYDNNGNITKITKGGTTIAQYTYDALNRLTSEAGSDGVKWNYIYDAGGNITSVTKTVNGTTSNVNSYTYSSTWGDQLTKIGSNTITYDSIGNPLAYNNGKEYNFDWIDGRQQDHRVRISWREEVFP